MFMLIAVIAMATYVLNFFFSFRNYMPQLNEPKDIDRELLQQKLDKAADKATGTRDQRR